MQYKFVKPKSQPLYLTRDGYDYHNSFSTDNIKNPNRLVFSAGLIEFKEDRIYKIINKSGHFCPKAEENILNFLMTLNEFLPKVVNLIDCFHKDIAKDDQLF